MAHEPLKLSQMTPAARARRIADLIKNPGTRSSVPTQYLPPELRAKRDLNTRLNAPIAPGSSTTQRDIARSANAATAVRYAPQEQALGTELGQAQAQQRDVPQWYADYVAQTAQHAQNAQTIAAAANTAEQNLQAGTKGLDQSNADAQAKQAQADAATRGATAADQTPTASQAAAVRQAILAAVGGTIASQGAASSNYADTVAHVVAPTQKLSAQVQAAGKVSDVRAKQTALKAEEGDYNASARQSGIADALKNELAAQVAGVNTAKTKADIQSTTTKTQKTQADIDFFNKHGYYPKTGPTPKPKAPTGYGAGAPGMNKYGYTYDEWNALSPKAQSNARAGKGKTAKPKGPDWQSQSEQSAGLSQLGPLKSYVAKAKSGEAFVAGHPKQQPLSRAQAVAKITANVASPKDPSLLSAALDAVYDGHLSAETVKRLIAAGFKPARVAQTLGVPTAGQAGSSSTYVRPPKKPTTGSRSDSNR